MNDYDSRLNYLGTFLAGLVLGSLIGASVAMLMAPSSGPETRRQIREKSLELRSQAEHQVEEARKRAEDVQERSRVVLEEQKARLNQAIEDAKRGAKQAKDDLDQATELPAA
ncbi:MAG TPA: YtxH domain-containing protein [Anaerolineae bacterium]|nr:YtxH domain-containing protein [Anaerolineae bacterium]